MRRAGFWILVGSFMGLLVQTGLAQESPLALDIASVPAEPGVVQVMLTNHSTHPVKIVRPTPDGQLPNLHLQLVAVATGDTMMVTVEPFTPAQLAAPAGQLLTNLGAGEQLLWPLAVDSYLPNDAIGTLTVIYPSIYQTPADTLHLPPRAQVWPADVRSNAIPWP